MELRVGASPAARNAALEVAKAVAVCEALVPAERVLDDGAGPEQVQKPGVGGGVRCGGGGLSRGRLPPAAGLGLVFRDDSRTSRLRLGSAAPEG